jgi:glycosyltransferase involved in cell wall biosynthesis
MIVLDDMSTDNTVETINNLANSLGLAEKITVKSRTEKYGEVRNTLVETKLCDPADVIVRLDAGDFITDLGCLEYLNAIYEKYDPAVLWTAHRWAFTDQNISGPVDPNVSVYKQPWRSSHMKTFRVNDFLGLNEANFKDINGDWIMIGCDQAVFLPMMERARLKGRQLIFLPRVMYHYNINLTDPSLFTSQRSLDQKASGEWIRDRGYIE